MIELIRIQSELNAPKNQYNSFGKYNYRNCEDILEALKPLLLREECLLTIEDEMFNLGNRFYLRATATISKGEKSISASALAREEENIKGMNQSQITGSASSYARKYALNGLFLIDDNKDQDGKNKHGKDEPDENTLAVWQSQVNNIKDIDELEKYWNQNKDVVKGNKAIMAVFTKRKKELNGV